ncbi:MAG: hypothetical protein Q4D82_06285 [Neisseria sp.]|nr:hypothetical protein [Neisseria sp.]
MAENAWQERNEEFKAIKAENLEYEALCRRLNFEDYPSDIGVSASDFALEYLNT